jgi:MOSC domain-containing protein YiiM
MSPIVESVNVGVPRRLTSRLGVSGIDKRPVAGPVAVRAPGPKGLGGSGLVGDAICDLRHHGGDTQAVYAFAREDLDEWETLLGGRPACGMFGENLTTAGIDITGGLVGEQWRVGTDLVLQVTDPRIPCRTFAAFLGRQGWIKTFTERAAPGTYLKVVSPGEVRRGDVIEVIHRPLHGVTVQLAFRAHTTEPDRFAQVLEAGDDLSPELRSAALRRTHSAVT